MKPQKIKVRNNKELYIRWEDESESVISLEKLRKLCPCATCITEKEKQSKSYIPIFNQNQIQLSKINQVGSYAISIVWKDGHNTGIYEYTYLKKLSTE
jgi:DUF971 family protein